MSRLQKKDSSRGRKDNGKKTSFGGVEARLKDNRFKCDICGNKFRLSEKIKHKTRCYECYHAMKDAEITCPICGNKYPLKRMRQVNVFVRPGKKGGKKYKTFYCMHCIGKVNSRCIKIDKLQGGEMKEAEKTQRKIMRKFIR